MKKLGAIFLLLLFFSPFILKVGIVASWFVHYDYILENICVQKDEEVNTCNGKCHLNKELQKVDESASSSEQAPDFNTSKLEYNPYINMGYFNLPTHNISVKKTQAFVLKCKSQFEPNLDIPPPRLS